ncbi:MAG: hypothetical protein ABI867_10420 [Kofleriaceae bacterium]
MAFDPIPQARVVRKAGHLVAPPRGPKTRGLGPSVGDRLKEGLAIAVGMWPLTAVMLLMVGLLIMAGNSGR